MSRRRDAGATALELIEEATHELRRSPAGTLAAYCAGSVPFCLALLYFIAGMSRNPFAREQCATSALILALAFFWMKAWHSVFGSRIRAQIAGESMPALRLRDWLRSFRNQLIVQPWGFLALPISLVLLFPFPHVYGFFQNAVALDYGRNQGALDLCRDSATQSSLNARQSSKILVVMFLFGFFVFVNLFVGMLQIPALLKMLLGIESAFTRGHHSFLNTSYLAVVVAAVWLCLDPLLKTVYALRCFYGVSRNTGQDLLREFPPRGSAAPLLAVCLVFCASASVFSARAAEPEPPPIASGDLDDSIERVIRTPEFMWRFPPEVVPPEDAEETVLQQFINSIVDSIRVGFEKVGGWLGSIFGWFIEFFGKIFGNRAPESPGGGGLSAVVGPLVRGLFYILLAVVLSALVIFGWRMWKARGQAAVAIESEAVAATPDLTRDDVVADELPEDGWIQLARELIKQGEYRLALRAFYLAGLAHLAEREIVRVARFKSNLDYVREVSRRGRAWPGLPDAFQAQALSFDRVWYGAHAVDSEVLASFETNLNRIRSC